MWSRFFSRNKNNNPIDENLEIVEDDTDISCNGNGIQNDQIKKTISSGPPKVPSNGDVHNDNSRSNSELRNGSGDLLVEDPNNVRNGSEDILYQIGNKPDDTRSSLSNPSNFSPLDIDEEISDEITLIISDEEGESKSTENKIKEDDCSKSLKRSLETDVDEVKAKKSKILIEKPEKREYVPMNFLREFMARKELKTISLDELEELCLQKMCESINQTSKIGNLNSLAKEQKQVIETLQTKYNRLKKHINDISTVQNKLLQEVRIAKAKKGGIISNFIMPVKITRSVGLQVSLQPLNRMRTVPAPTEQLVTAAASIQKRKVQQISLPNKLPSAQKPVTPITTAKPISAIIPKLPNFIPTPNKVLKTLLPRTYSGPDKTKDVSSSTNSFLGTYLTTSTPKTPMPNVVRKTTSPTNCVSSAATRTTAKLSKVIDLTLEDDIAKAAPAIPLTPAGIRVIAPHQLRNTISTAVTSQIQRVTYLVSPVQQGQVFLATTSAPTIPGRPTSTIMLTPVPVQQGQVPNGQLLNFVRSHSTGIGTVTVLPATPTAPIRTGQLIYFQTSGTTVNSLLPQMTPSTRITPTTRHPAPLPIPPAAQPSQPTWKAMPPIPSLKITKISDGIVLSWKMFNNDMSLYEDIASYQLYSYQETNDLPSTDMWLKVGDVKALTLPMACTLAQFTKGNKYHFAVRAVDIKCRVGPFSHPVQIELP